MTGQTFRKRRNKSVKINEKKIRIIWVVDIVIFAVGIFLDQWAKTFMTKLLKDKDSIAIIRNVLELHYLENRGAAFGMLQGKRWYFILIAVFVLVVIGWLLVKLPHDKKYNKLHIALSLILAGAIGNTIDRVIRGYVVDYIYFKLINFPVFNIADIYITVTTIWLAIMILFCYKEEDFDFLRKETQRKE